MRHYLTPLDPHILYPYTWQAEHIRLTTTPYGTRTESKFEGTGLLLHPGRYLVLEREADALGFPLSVIMSIEVFKRGRWWKLLRQNIVD